MSTAVDAADSIDIRSFSSEALSMAKGATSINRTLKYGMRTKMRYSYNPSLALGESCLPAEVYTGEKLKHKLRKVTTLPTSNKVELRFDHWGTESLESSPEEYDQKCFYAFKVFAKPIGDLPSVKSQLGLPFSDLQEAIRLIQEIKNIKPSKQLNAMYHFNRQQLISWKEFKDYVDRIFDRESMRNKSQRPPSPVSKLLQQFQKPVQRQPTAQGALMTPTGLSTAATTAAATRQHQLTAATVAASVTEVDIHGRSVPAGKLKDAISNVYRKERAFQRGLDTKGSMTTAPKTIAAMLSYDTSFTDSTRGLPTRENSAIVAPSATTATTTAATATAAATASSIDGIIDLQQEREQQQQQQLVLPSFSSERSGAKMRDLVNPQGDYLQRWTAMKQQRDQRMLREERKEARKELLHNFQRLVVNSEASEYQRISNQQFLYERGSKLARYEETVRMKRQVEYNCKSSKETRRQRLLEERSYARETLEQSLSMSRSLREESLFEFRSEEESMPGLRLGAVGSVELDQATSSVVQVPAELQQQLRNARSVAAFEAAQERIRVYYTSTMSSRISSYAHSREAKIRRAGEAEKRVHITPIIGSTLFDDSIVSLMTDELSDEESPFHRTHNHNNTHSHTNTYAHTHSSNKTRTPSRSRSRGNSRQQQTHGDRVYQPVHETNRDFDLSEHLKQVQQQQQQHELQALQQQQNQEQQLHVEEIRHAAAVISRQQAQRDQNPQLQQKREQQLQEDIHKALQKSKSLRLDFDIAISDSENNSRTASPLAIQLHQEQKQSNASSPQQQQQQQQQLRLPPINGAESIQLPAAAAQLAAQHIVDRTSPSSLRLERSDSNKNSSNNSRGGSGLGLLRAGSNRDLLSSSPPAGKGAVGGLCSPSRANQRKDWIDLFNKNSPKDFNAHSQSP